MKQLAVVICNYNKKDYVIKCLESVINSSFDDLDIFVVDNASTDGSVDAIKKQFRGDYTLVTNANNVGGSGGFNTGIKKAIVKSYECIMLLDNDVVLDEYAIEASIDFLHANKDVAVVGSKLLQMNNPKYLQEMGAMIDFENFHIKPLYKNHLDDESIPSVVYCDFVPACALMVRSSAVAYVGLFDEDNFIYWDDIEWGHRLNQAGFKVACFGESRAYHVMGAADRKNTFATYYFWRNRIKFFSQVCGVERLKRMCRQILKELFQALYACNYVSKNNTIETLMYAYDDAINKIYGEAREGIILPNDDIENRFAKFFSQDSRFLVYEHENIPRTLSILHKVMEANGQVRITLVTENSEMLKSQFENIHCIHKTEKIKDFDHKIQLVKHIFEVDEFINDMVYVDEHENLAMTAEDFDYCKGYKSAQEFFNKINEPIMFNKLSED